jgi:hypothetical protein
MTRNQPNPMLSNLSTVKKHARLIILCSTLSFLLNFKTYAQAEFTTWGNLTGIRTGGQLMEFGGSVCIVNADWSKIRQTAKERQRIRFTREGNKKIFVYSLDSLTAKQTIESTGPGLVTVEMEYRSHVDTVLAGAFFRIDLPADHFSGGTVQPFDQAVVSLIPKEQTSQDDYLQTNTKGLNFISPRRQLEITFNEPTAVAIKDNRSEGFNDLHVYLAILPGHMKKNETVKKIFHFKATGEVDKEPVELKLETSKAGRAFVGVGGNFRLQNPETDPAVIDYCLKNMRVAYGRVEMPWRFWHAEEHADPVKEAREGKLHPRVQAAMEMAQRLFKMGIPVIVSDWSAPDWAIVGHQHRPQHGVFGNPLNQEKAEKIYESITSYFLFLKEKYGVQVEAFSFNESDLGINVRQTAAEHATLIKGLGAHFASKKLKTKLLLGDTADMHGWPFAKAAANKETLPYVSDLSVHSWRGYTDEHLEHWADLARELNKPLIIGEGSIDAGAWRYPAIFEEATYALDEINLYIRLLAACQPKTILQWQLTADYSPLSGGGVFGNKSEPLHPTQRFWNLKQLGSTPPDVFSFPIVSNNSDVTCAAVGNNKKGVYAIHVVNNGPSRHTTLEGLPANVKELHIFVTDEKRTMTEGKKISVSKGKAHFTLDPACYATLMSVKK